MVLLYLLVLGPALAGMVVALVWWLIWGRKWGLPGGGVSAFSLIAGLALVVGSVALPVLSSSILFPLDMPREFWEWYRDYRFTVPLVLGTVGMVILAFPVRVRRGGGAAELSPRTPVSFARGWWFVTPAAILALILAFTISAGAASQPDPSTGHYTMYVVELGETGSMGTSIYGWYYSVPCLILIGVMILVAILGLTFISRPALDHDLEQDARIRRVRTRNILAVVTGAFLAHLGLILGSLAGTSSIRAQFRTSEGNVAFWSTFAALGPALSVAAMIAAALGLAFWAAVALSAIPSRRLEPATLPS